MPWYNIEFRYDDEIEADNEDYAHAIVMKRLQDGELDIIIDVTEIQE